MTTPPGQDRCARHPAVDPGPPGHKPTRDDRFSLEGSGAYTAYRGVIVNATTFGKDRYAFAHRRRRRRDRTSIHRTGSALRMKQFRSQSDAGVTLHLHGRAPKWTVHEDTAAVVQMDWMD